MTNSNSEITFPAFKATKHGTVILVLPERIFWTDLMDVNANPGPGIDRVNVMLWKPRSIRSQFKSTCCYKSFKVQLLITKDFEKHFKIKINDIKT